MHAAIAPRFDVRDAEGALEHHLRNLQVVDRYRLIKSSVIYIPYATVDTPQGEETVLAAPLSEAPGQLFTTQPISGALFPFEDVVGRDAEIIMPGEEFFQWHGDRHTPTPLIHVPFYRLEYSCLGKRYLAYVDGLEAQVMAQSFPPAPAVRADMKYAAWWGSTLAGSTLAAFLTRGGVETAAALGAVGLLALAGRSLFLRK
jgi:hypothetical protein